MIDTVPRPEIVKRECGGYLAVSPPSAPLRIGVTAASEAEAETEFLNTYMRWCAILAKKENPAVAGFASNEVLRRIAYKRPQ